MVIWPSSSCSSGDRSSGVARSVAAAPSEAESTSAASARPASASQDDFIAKGDIFAKHFGGEPSARFGLGGCTCGAAR